ncbi:MAG: biotin/lipoyl-containing protein [Aerococcus sp.]|nr:biotin/lipoyl-containing protein [Aerococcus sp.]
MLRKFRMRVNGKEYLVEMEELGETPTAMDSAPIQKAAPKPAEAPAASTPAPQPQVGAGETVTAPMPGTVLDILVKVGDHVEEDQPILILEAMKMENKIVSPLTGTITGITVAKGDSADVDQVLFTVQGA